MANDKEKTTMRIPALRGQQKSRQFLSILRATVSSSKSNKYQNQNENLHLNLNLKRSYSTKVPAYFGNEKPGEFSYLSIPGELPLIGKTIGALVDHAAEKFGEKEALCIVHEGNKRLTYAQLRDEADLLASGLLKLGLEPCDRIGIWGPNSRQWYVTELAAAKAGLISVYVNPAYQPRELLYSINKVGMKSIIIAGEHKTQNYYNLLVEAVPEAKDAPLGQLKSAKAPTLKSVIYMEEEVPGKGLFTYNQVLNDGQPKEVREAYEQISSQVQSDDVLNIQFTSGTTGNPKGVMLSHHNIVNNSFLIGKRLGMTSEDRLCLTVPLFHCYGNVAGMIAALHVGASTVFPSPTFSGKAGINVAAKEKCTLMYGTPTMHIDMLNCPDLPNLDLSSLRTALTAGAICPEELIKEMKVKYTVKNVTSLYGLTETSPVFFQSLPQDSDELRAVTVGYPTEHCEVKLVDSEGKIVPVGAEGEMCVRGYMVMRGYWNDPDKTRESIDVSRWFHSGDLFKMLPSGHAIIVGRLKDMIIRGGENIYPKEIEEFLHAHPSILEAQVFGVPDKRLGETVAAWINVKEGATLTEEEITKFCKGQIATYKIPQYIKFTADFPRTTSGKIQKFAMRSVTIEELQLS